MNTIEQAAKRLEQLRRAGVELPVDAPPPDTATPSERPPQPVATARSAPAAARVASVTDDRRSREVSVDLPRMRRAGLLVPGQPRSQLEEEFRIVKRPLLENVRNQTAMRPERANLIMVTSAIPGEGKTQTALNLAGVGGVILLIGLAGGWWFVGRSLRPISEISSTATKISAGDLSQRINTAEAESELGQLAAVLNSTFARLETAFASLDQKAQGKHCEGMSGILKEGKAVLAEDFDETTMDACLIASAQRVEHYEMAAYGTLVAWARSLALCWPWG